MSIKHNLKFILFPIIVVAMLAAIWGYLAIHGQPKAIATYEQVWSAAEERGFTPVDSTDAFIEAWGENSDGLEKALSFQTGEKKLHFFVFDSDKKAHSIRASYWSYLRYDSGRYGTAGTNVEYKSSGANFTVYAVKTDDYYTVCTRVGNTVIYAECDTDARKSICEIIEQIGYN